MHTRPISIIAALVCAVASAQTVLPWHRTDACERQVFAVRSAQKIRDAAVSLPLLSADRCALVDADAPETAQPVFVSASNLIVRLPGPLAPDRPRFIAAYFGCGTNVSPRLAEAPAAAGDFASDVLGRAWDFEDGSPCGIAGWGNRADDLGPVSVKNGWLQIPVRGNDPYFIFGDMFGPAASPRNLRIDSSVYRFLELRIRQSCADAEWRFFVTDADGRYKAINFTVRGPQAQDVRFDLRAAFPDFWDGRPFKALRVDLPKNKPGLLAEVDHVRLLPEPPAASAGPRFTRDAAAARAAVRTLSPKLPTRVTAGVPAHTVVKATGAARDVRVLWAFAAPECGAVTVEAAPDDVTLPALTRAGDVTWTFGLADDLGQPLLAKQGRFEVRPAALAAFRLTPACAFVSLASPSTALTVQGLDAFGNPLPVDIRKPRWHIGGSASVADGRLNGNPATATITCASDHPAAYTVALDDGSGHCGETRVTTVAYRKNLVRLAPNGYLATADGAPYFPVGGLYANWPHRPNADGTISRSADLFPCGPAPYAAGFPWSAKTETAVADYLRHCHDRGINCLRLMLRNMDLVGRTDAVQLQAVLHLFDLAHPYGIRFNVALMEDYDKPPYVSAKILEKIVLPHYSSAELAALPPHRARFLVRKDVLASPALRYTDPDAMACQRDYLRELIPVLAGREEVLCYEFENEMVYPPMSWCRATAACIREIDPRTLILGNPGPHEWPEPLLWRDSGCDLFSYHPYNDGTPAADHGAVVFLRSKYAAQSRLPFYTGEGGLNQNRWQAGVKRVPPEAAARGTRDQLWMSVCCGASGSLYWTLENDLEAQAFAAVRPAFDALGLDFHTLKRQRPGVALALGPKRRDPRDAALAMRLLDLGVDFDTVTTNEASAYETRIALDTPPESLDLAATVAKPATGWQIATLFSSKDGQALLYLRNVAGGVKDFGAKPRPCHLRDVEPAEAAFALREPWKRAVAFDIDTRQARALSPDAAGRVSLGVTSHDFLIGLRR